MSCVLRCHLQGRRVQLGGFRRVKNPWGEGRDPKLSLGCRLPAPRALVALT